MSNEWQNGTQEQLDAARDDAMLIPEKTYFKSLYGQTRGEIVYRIDSPENSDISVLMRINGGDQSDWHGAHDLEPINAE